MDWLKILYILAFMYWLAVFFAATRFEPKKNYSIVWSPIFPYLQAFAFGVAAAPAYMVGFLFLFFNTTLLILLTLLSPLVWLLCFIPFYGKFLKKRAEVGHQNQIISQLIRETWPYWIKQWDILWQKV